MAISLMGAGAVPKKLVFRTLRVNNLQGHTDFSVKIDAKSIPGWSGLTTQNFYISQVGVNPKNTTNAGTISRSYDQSTGQLTVKISAGSSVSLWNPVEVVCVTMEDE